MMPQTKWQQISEWARSLHPQSTTKERSAAYYQWRHQFVHNRLNLGIWIAIAAELFLAATELLIEHPLTRLSNQASFHISLPDAVKDFQPTAITLICLLAFQQILKHSKWRHSPIKLLPIFTFITLIIGSTLYIPSTTQVSSEIVIDVAIVFWCQAIIVPVQWQSHLLAQLLSMLFIAISWAITVISQPSDTTLLVALIDISWGALYCLMIIISANIMASYSEQLSWHEFNLREQLEISLKTVSQDLQKPIRQSQQLLKNLQPSTTTADVRPIHIPKQTVQQLLDNSNRQLSLLGDLLAAADRHD